MRSTRLAVLSAATLALGGCATIFTGTTDTLSFSANVPGVRLTIDGQYQGELPLTIPMSRSFISGRQFVATFEKSGYVTQEFRLNRDFNAVAILDITSIPTSGGIDLLTGSLFKFSPKDYHVQMLAVGQSARSPEYRRVLGLYAFALVNYRAIQKDLARGGGESLATFAAAAAGGRADGAAAFTEASLRNAPALLAAGTAQEFVERVGGLLDGTDALRAYRM